MANPTTKSFIIDQGPVVRSLVSTNRWLRGSKTYRFPWYLTLVSANHASSNPGQASFPAERKRVAQIDPFNEPTATVGSQSFCLVKIRFFKKFITLALLPSPPIPGKHQVVFPQGLNSLSILETKLIVAKFRGKFMPEVPLVNKFYSQEICFSVKTDT